ncbi:lasso peptide [Rivularia sp. UHCC 0363]|uniref:lasso peptide n=1 Tax=Rivularia sp. UHCC 0363 TaxID=3110244 RepID=UPI002B1F7739|nr:lasso peptide [Rivularia sp. UHCC 0363]MEA5598339.1 lasso peptide [Rivularia sp. UHCC 0363]
MKRTYTAPKLTSFGNVTEITQVNGTSKRGDFAYLNGEVLSDGDDFGSFDICIGSKPPGAKCDPRI